MQSEEDFRRKIESSPIASITEKNGQSENLTVKDVAKMGLGGELPATGARPIFKTDNGWSYDVAYAPAHIELDTSTGNVKITAPKEITDSEMFRQVFDEETLNKYSQAYKLNNDYKVPVREKNEETGEEEEKEVTIPEYIERLNSSLSNYMQNLRNMHATREKTIEKYGDKAKNLTDDIMRIVTQEQSGGIYLPDTIFSVGSFGGGRKNPFLALKDKRNENDVVSLEDFVSVYDRDNFDRDEMAALLAHIEGALSGSSWSPEETYVDGNGTEHKNRNSAKEAAKLIAFKDYIISNNPHSEWNQQIGDFVESLFYNASYQVTKIFGNMANLGEMVVTQGNGTFFQNGVEQMDEAMEYYNSNKTLVWDAVTNAQIWGTIGGIALGTWGSSLPMKYLGLGIDKTSKFFTAKYLAWAASHNGEISLGARLAYGALTMAQKVTTAIDAATAAISGIVRDNIFLEYVFDTIHDAILYDAAGFRSVLTNLAEGATFDEKAGRALEYWIGQYVDNAKWWGPVGAGRTLAKAAGKTTLGKATNIVATKYINKLETLIGRKVQNVQDNMAGGSVVRKLEEKLESLGENEKTKRFRLEKKIEIEKQNELLREARATIGNVKLEWDGLKLTDESYNEWKEAMTSLKARENAINFYRYGTEAEIRRMHQELIDPATGKGEFLYAELAGANDAVSKWYFKLVELNDKYGLSVVKNNLLNQDVIDYYVGSYKLNILNYAAENSAENAADAQKAAAVVSQNLERVKNRLPNEITDYVDVGIQVNVVQSYYKRLNEYGIANKILDKGLIDSYYANPMWAENGWMPIVVKTDPGGRWIAEDDKIESIVEQEMYHYKYKANYGEHYEDPELVRQVRIRHFAQATNNRNIWKSYAGFGSNATNVTVVSGEETAYARQAEESIKKLQDVVSYHSSKMFDEANFDDIRRVADKNTPHLKLNSDKTRSMVVSNLSPSEVDNLLLYKGIITKSGEPLTDNVTEKNYQEWFDGQSDPVKKFLIQKYEEQGAKIIPIKTTDESNMDVGVDGGKEATLKNTTPEQADMAQQIITPQSSPSKVTKIPISYTRRIDVDGGDIDAQSVEVRFGETSGFVREVDTSLLGPVEGTVENGYEFLKKSMSNDGDIFQQELKRAYILGNKDIANSRIMEEAARNLANGKQAFYEGTLLADVKGALRKIAGIDADEVANDIYLEAVSLVDKYVDEMSKNQAIKRSIDILSKNSNAGQDVYKFFALSELSKKQNLKKASDAFEKQLDKVLKKSSTDGIEYNDAVKIKKQANKLLLGIIENESNNSRLAVNTIDSGLLSTEELFEEVKDINRRISNAEDRLGQDYVMYLDDNGRSTYAKVDPTFASLFNYRYKLEKGEASALAKVNAAMSKMFRFGTTSVNLSSFGNQLFRDFGNALFVGGAWDTIKANYQNLVDVFGERIVEQIKNFDPEGYEVRQIQEFADRTGKTIEEAAVSREFMRGQAMAPSTTERTLYKNFMSEAYSSKSDSLLVRAKSKFQTLVEKYNPDDILNGKRENYLRNRVYASSLNDALKEGYSLEQARVYADFAMNNVTTNFTRQIYHFQAIADSTPYFRAAINGSKSFWRLWSVDPVGISGRIVGGLILPTMYLTGMSLGSEENKEVYKNIPEYQKENNMVFVVNGQIMSIPIPQELGSIVAPFRQFVEYLHDSNKNDFWELMMNDLLGLSPVDITGFTSIDMDKMLQDPTFLDRVSRGTARMFSQMAPVPVRSAYMWATGTDPYTGKSLQDKSYMYWNDETGSLEVMDYNQNAFAKWFADTFKNTGISAELAEKIVSGIIGTTGSNLLSNITKLVQENGEAMMRDFGDKAIEQATRPFTVEKYNLVDSIWKRGVRQLTSEKQAILDSKEMKRLNSELSQTKDPEKRKKLLSQRQDLVDAFQQKVGDLAKNLTDRYEGTLDRKKIGAIIALLNFNSDSLFQSGSQYSSTLSSELFWDSRNAAIHTMERLGITGSNDMSIFGYITTDNEGNPVVKYSSPIAIMDMKNQWNSQDEIHAANIKALISQNNLYDAHQAVANQIQKIYGSKSKLTNQDYANIEAIQINWNGELAKTIAPYISKMTPEAAINNTEVLNALYPYVEVPGSWEVNNKGRSVSLGDRGSKKKAYYDSWVKSMFSVNDKYKGQY